MNRRRTTIWVGVLCLVAGALVSPVLGWPRYLPEVTESDDGIDLPAAATKQWFRHVSDYDTGGEPLDDERFEELMAALDRAMTARETLADFDREAMVHLFALQRRLAVPEVTGEQRERIESYMRELAERHPDNRAVIDDYGSIDSYAAPNSWIPWLAYVVVIPIFTTDYDNHGGPFADAQVDRLLAALDAVLTLPDVAADLPTEGEPYFDDVSTQLQRGRISQEQIKRIVGYLDELEQRHPDATDFIDKQRFRIAHLMPGATAPNIVGKDTEGVEFTLEDYRGKIVVLIFSGQWCGPCLAEYPYQRFMLDFYDEEDVVLLSVNSDARLETIVEAKNSGAAPQYRTWWDGYGAEQEEATEIGALVGPIAAEWSVSVWPMTYVIDEKGVVRYGRKLGGELIAAVDELVSEKRLREHQEQRAAEAHQ